MSPDPVHPAVALLSGGLDSSVALALALQEGPALLAITFDYGQQAAAAEARAAAAIAATLDVPHQVISLPVFPPGSSGALLGQSEIPDPTREELDRGGERMEQTAAAVWVPNRNGVLLEVAAAQAECLGADHVIVGFNREEAATFPDNSREYLDRVNAALALSTRRRVRVVSPTVDLDKAVILQEGQRLGLPLDRIWACYRGGERPCGRCESCGRLLRAAERTGISLGWDTGGSDA